MFRSLDSAKSFDANHKIITTSEDGGDDNEDYAYDDDYDDYYEPDGNDDDNDYSEKDLKEELLCPLHNIGAAQGFPNNTLASGKSFSDDYGDDYYQTVVKV